MKEVDRLIDDKNHYERVFSIDEEGNIYISGYSPMMLKFLESGFNGELFLNKLLDEYKRQVNCKK